MSTHGVVELRSDGNTFSLEIRTAVKAELEQIVSSPAFAQSNRCKRFLNFVVTQTLAGRAGELKERTIGISVFERANDYDTGGDSIVRVTSNEVRKRIGQFYKESLVSHPIQIELPRGSYVPEFRIQPSRKESGLPSLSQQAHSESATTPIPEQLNPAPLAAEHLENTSIALLQIERTEHSTIKRSRRLRIGVAVVLVLVAGLAGGIWKSQRQGNYPQIWESFLHANTPVLICLGTHNLSATHTVANEEKERFSDLVLHNEMIPVDDVTVITSMASLLGIMGIAFCIICAGQA
jgi:hypothetical protein